MSLTAAALSIDSENYLFHKLDKYRPSFPNLIFRRQYNDRWTITVSLCESIRKNVAMEMDGSEDMFCIDSKPIEVCRIVKAKCCKMGRTMRHHPVMDTVLFKAHTIIDNEFYVICGLSGMIHSYVLTKAAVYDINYLKDVRWEYHDYSIFGDRGYTSKSVQLDLFETANIKL